MSREDILDRILYCYFLEQLFSVATGRLDKLFSVLILILGSSVIFNFNPLISGIGIVIISSIQTTYEFGKKSGNAGRKAAEYLLLYDDANEHNDTELKTKLHVLEKTDENIWSSLKDIAILKTQIKIGIPTKHQTKLSLHSRLLRLICG